MSQTAIDDIAAKLGLDSYDVFMNNLVNAPKERRDVYAEEMKVAETLYPAAQQAMRQQRFMPNRLSMMCSRRNCSYWRHCEREWGGEVPES